VSPERRLKHDKSAQVASMYLKKKNRDTVKQCAEGRGQCQGHDQELRYSILTGSLARPVDP